MSQICAFSVLPSTVIERVANSTPIVDFVSRLNSLRVNRESTGGGTWSATIRSEMVHVQHTVTLTTNVHKRNVSERPVRSLSSYTHDFPTPESPMRTTCTKGAHINHLRWRATAHRHAP